MENERGDLIGDIGLCNLYSVGCIFSRSWRSLGNAPQYQHQNLQDLTDFALVMMRIIASSLVPLITIDALIEAD